MTIKPIVSKKTRYEFREALTFWVLRRIEIEFDSADISRSKTSQQFQGARRTLVEEYYASLDFTNWHDVRKLLKVYEAVLEVLFEESKDIASYVQESAKKRVEILLKHLEKDGFFLDESGHIQSSESTFLLPELFEFARTLDSHELQKQIDRVKSSIDNDPGLAIGTSKELLETTCKTILIESKIHISESWEIPELIKETRKVLKLIPDCIPSSAKGAETIKRLLSNLGTIAHGLSELRNLYGTGHGRTIGAKTNGISPRHARLAVGAATTLAVFLFDTFRENIMKKEAS